MPFKTCTIGICSWASSPICNSSVSHFHHISAHIRSSSPLSERLKRRYATLQEDHSKRWSDTSSSVHDVPAWPTTKHPTPYEIFGISKGAKYDKKRFYDLVKHYHPDTRDRRSSAIHTTHPVSHDTCLERYHLVIAANKLLSDPDKRRLYDNHGIGWAREGQQASTLRERDRSWRQQPGNAANNATWEDWERWHDAQNGKSSGPMYMPHRMFASCLVLFCLVASMAQTSRAENAGVHYVEWMSQQNAVIGSELRRNGMQAAGRSKDERVDFFLRDRENVNYRFVPSKYDSPEQEKPS